MTTGDINSSSDRSPLKDDHSENLQLCSNLRNSFLKGIDVQRIKAYTDWYWQNHLKQHFENEEHLIFPMLGKANPLVKRAMADHRRLRRLFESKDELHKAMSRIEEELSAHVHFEERVLFKEIEQHAGKQAFDAIGQAHPAHHDGANWPDQFWK